MPSKSEFVLDADASQLVAETKRSADATTELEKAVKSVIETSIKGHKDVIEHLQKEGAAVKSLLVDNENLKTKIKELTEKHETYVQSVEKGAKGMSDIAKGLSGAAIFQLIGNLIDEQTRWNKEIVNTQVEYDKLAIKARTALMMSSKDFEKVYSESIFPTTQKYKVSQETATSAYAAASFVPEKDRAGVLQRSVEGAKAAGVDDNSIVEYEKAIFARLNQEGKAITADAVHKASLSMANIGGAKLKMSGDEILSAQQTFGKVEGMDQDQMWAEFATLKKKGGMDSGKAAQQMSMIATSLHALSDPAKKMMGDELTAGVEGEMSKGNIMGAISMIKQAMDQQNLSPEARAKFGQEVVGKRALPGFERLLSNQDFAGGVMKGAYDEDQFGKRLGIATEGASATDAALDAQKKDIQIRADKLKQQNQAAIKAALIEAEAQGVGPGISFGPIKTGRALMETQLNMSAAGNRDVMGDMLAGIGSADSATQFHGLSSDFAQRVQARIAQAQAPTEAVPTEGGAPVVRLPSVPSAPSSAFQKSPEEKAKQELEMARLHREQAEAGATRDHKGNIRKADQRTIRNDAEYGDAHLKVLEAIQKQLELANKEKAEQRSRNSANAGA